MKLSKINVRPCLACKKCVPDNVCKVRDDFPELAEKIKKSKALIIGAYIPYGQIDGFTKALLERFWSLGHVNNLLRGKLCATILTGLMPDMLDNVNQSLAAEIREYERMDLIGQLTITSIGPIRPYILSNQAGKLFSSSAINSIRYWPYSFFAISAASFASCSLLM